jgi:hypothetical protein
MHPGPFHLFVTLPTPDLPAGCSKDLYPAAQQEAFTG